MFSSLEEKRQYDREAKQKERKIEKYLIKYKAWERYPGESYADFKRRFKSVKILVEANNLSEEERIKLITELQKN